MNLKIKHQLISKSILNKISLNQKKNILACIFQAQQNVVFLKLSPNYQSIQQIFTQSSRPLALMTALAWNSNGTALALGMTKVQIWVIKNDELSHYKIFNQDFIQIRMIAWAPDSISYACIGIHKIHSIVIRNIQTGQSRSINLDLMIASISFDPFGSNKALILSRKLQQQKLINLCRGDEKISTIKQVRWVSWSADYSYVICPSLSDNKLPIALTFSRIRNFAIKQIYIGHPSSISCIKFNPKLYQFNGQITQIFIMGDTSGYMTLWRISPTKQYKQPLLLIKSHPKSDQIIQQIQWDSNGQCLLVNTHKCYIIIIKFDKTKFGRQLSNKQHMNHLSKLYGVSSSQQIQDKNLQIYTIGSKQQNKNNQITLINKQQNLINDKIINQEKPKQYIITQQKNITGPNNKKRIIPSMKIQKKQAQKLQKSQQQKQIIKKQLINKNIQQKQQIKLCFKKIYQKFKVKLIYRLTSFTTLEIKKIDNNNNFITLLQLVQIKDHFSMNQDGQKIIKNQRAFQGNIEYINILSNFICVYNQKNLYIFDQELNIISLPLFLGDLYLLTINQQSDVYGISTQGILRGYNLSQRKLYCQTSIRVLLQGQLKNDDPIKQIKVHSDHRVYIRLKQSRNQYFLDLDSKIWHRIDFVEGTIRRGNSIRITTYQQKQIRQFFTINKLQSNKNQTSLSSLQYNLIYYKKYAPNITMFKQTLISLVKQLNSRKMDMELRNILNRYFFKIDSINYIKDNTQRQTIWNSIKQISGKVIDQFIYLNSN